MPTDTQVNNLIINKMTKHMSQSRKKYLVFGNLGTGDFIVGPDVVV